MESLTLNLFLAVINQPEDDLLEASPHPTFDRLVKYMLDEMPSSFWARMIAQPKGVQEACLQRLTTAQRACFLRRQGGVPQHLYEVLDALRRQMDAFAFMQRHDLMWEATYRLVLQLWQAPKSTPLELLQALDVIIQRYAICNVLRPENQTDASWLLSYWKEDLPPPHSVSPPAWPG
ncbi:MAG: hypothetical protein AAFQ98_11600 [Bacteroidota bacterium]